MPEGHKTHFIAKQHSELFGGRRLKVSSPQGRFADGAKAVNNQTLDRVVAAGKHLFYRFESSAVVHVHLGRYGSFREYAGTPKPVGLVRMRLSDSETTVDLNGPTQCRVIDVPWMNRIIETLGPDPLAGGKWQDAWQAIRISKKPIGALLLDQAVIAGVGNIFRAELLFELRMNPLTKGNEMQESDFREMWKSLSKMMKTGVRYGKIITVTAREVGQPLAKLGNKERVRIYGKDLCPRCEGPIEIIVVAARNLYVCPACQSVPK